MDNLLKKFKNISPDSDFKARSRSLVLASEQKEIGYGIWLQQFLVPAVGVLAMVLFLVLGTARVLDEQGKRGLASLNAANLASEVKNLDIQIQLSQAQYYNNSAANIELALRAASGDLKQEDQYKLNWLLDNLTL